MTPSEQITAYLAELPDWRGTLLTELRACINEAAPTLTEEWKWGVPVWTGPKMVCAISAFKNHVKINFFKGVYLPDPHKIINAGLDSKEHRSIDFYEGDHLDKTALKELVQAAASYKK